jgi:penicillin-binding protein 1A
VRAALTNFRAGHVVAGGSTITQQTAKIVFLTPTRTYSRKFDECSTRRRSRNRSARSRFSNSI